MRIPPAPSATIAAGHDRARAYNTRVTPAEYRGRVPGGCRKMAQRTIEFRYRTLRKKRFSLIVCTA